MSKYYLVPEKTLIKLISESNDLIALLNSGVDNWIFYNDALDDYYTECGEQLNIKADILRELKEKIIEEDLKKYTVADVSLP